MRLNRRFAFLAAFIVFSFVLIHKLSNWSVISDYRDEYQKSLRLDSVEANAAEKEICYYDSSCGLPRILFRLHAETALHPPFGCLNDIRLFHNNVSVGLNVVSLNGSTGDVMESQTFDVTSSDGKLIKWLRDLPEFSVIVGVSFGDIAERVSRDAREAFKAYGAQKIDQWRTGQAYSIIGQRWLKGSAYEQLIGLNTHPTTDVLEGCFDLPLGDIRQVNITETNSQAKNINRLDEERLAQLTDTRQNFGVKLGKSVENCGVKEKCAKDTIAMSFYSGEHKDDYPRVCVGGRMVFDKNLNGAGRGLNVFSLEPKTGRVRLASNFDTYQDESTALEEFLDEIPSGDVVAAVSFDEASTGLSEMAKQIFYELGSSQIHRLKFRASWYFVGQKGIRAYTPFEDLIYPAGNNWAKPIDTAICVPKSLSQWTGRLLSTDREKKKNLPKRHFCAKYDKHDEFCSEKFMDDPIAPMPLSDSSHSADLIYNIPILVVAGLSTTSLQKCLQTLMNQEGLNTQMVLVVYDKQYPENADLAALFHAKSLAVNISSNFDGLVYEAISHAFSLFPSAPAVAVIEEDTIPTTEWLKFFEQTLPILLKDDTVDLILAHNVYGSTNNSRGNIVYRVDFQLPGYSYLLPRRFYDNYMHDNSKCCSNRTTGWQVSSAAALMPEMSRISLADNSFSEQPTSEITFNTTEMLNEDFRSAEAYESSLKQLIASSPHLNLRTRNCAQLFSQNYSSAVVVVVDGADLATIFGCFISGDIGILPSFKNVYRFYSHNTDFLIVQKDSPLISAASG